MFFHIFSVNTTQNSEQKCKVVKQMLTIMVLQYIYYLFAISCVLVANTDVSALIW